MSQVLNCGSVLAPPFTSDSPSKLFSLLTLVIVTTAASGDDECQMRNFILEFLDEV